MVRRNVIMLAVWAIGSFVMTLAILSPAHLNADGPDVPALPPPSLTSQGIVLTMTYQGDPARATPITVDAGELGAVALIAVNTTDQSQELKVNLWARSTSISPMLRSLPMPVETWKQEVTINLAPGEKKAIPLAPTAKLEAATNTVFQAQAGERGGMLLSLSVPSPQLKQIAELIAANSTTQTSAVPPNGFVVIAPPAAAPQAAGR